MKAWKERNWSWDINGLSLHYYTVGAGLAAEVLGDRLASRPRRSSTTLRMASPCRTSLTREDRSGRGARLAQPGRVPGAAQRLCGASPYQHLRASRRPRAHGDIARRDPQAMIPDGKDERADADFTSSACNPPGCALPVSVPAPQVAAGQGRQAWPVACIDPTNPAQPERLGRSRTRVAAPASTAWASPAAVRQPFSQIGDAQGG